MAFLSPYKSFELEDELAKKNIGLVKSVSSDLAASTSQAVQVIGSALKLKGEVLQKDTGKVSFSTGLPGEDASAEATATARKAIGKVFEPAGKYLEKKGGE